MLAARLWGTADLRVEDVADPGEPPAGWARIRVQACGVCGTDLEEFQFGPNIVPTEPHPLTGAMLPLTLGHEAVGVVEAVGAGANLDVGARVAVEGNLYCGTCWWCHRREYQLCEQLAGIGLMMDGGLADVLLAPGYMCIPFSDAVSFEEASLAEPLAVAVRAVARAGIGPGSSVAVVGAGTVGLLTIQVARLAGAKRILAIDTLEQRRRLATQLGADIAVAPDLAESAGRELTGGVGVDVALEVAGNPAAGTAAVRLARKGGTAVLLGVFDQPMPIDMMDFLMGEKTVLASLSHTYDGDFTRAVSLLEHPDLSLAPLITDRIPLADTVAGFEALIKSPANHLKVVVLPNSEESPSLEQAVAAQA